MNFKLIIYLIIIHYSLFSIHYCFAQDGGVKITNRTEKIDTINGKKYFIHIVLKGQTLYSIAKAYSVSVDDVIKENPEITKEPIHPDQKLKIPANKYAEATKIAPPPPVKKDSFINHTVKSKETMYSLTKKYNVTDEQIRNANPSLNMNLQPGQIIKIPYVADTISEKKKTTFLGSIFKKTPKTTEKKDTILKAKPKPKVDSLAIISKKTESESSPCKDVIRSDVFNAALILPLNLNEVSDIVTSDLDGELKPASTYKSLTCLQYYEGAKVALDSLQKQGLNVKFYVYDVGNDSTAVDKIIKKPEFENMNIIFCPQLIRGYSGFVKFAKKHNIRFITFSQSNAGNLKDYSFAYRLTTSTDEQFKQLSEFIINKYLSDNILIVYQGSNLNEKKYADLTEKKLIDAQATLKNKMSSIISFDYAKDGLAGLKDKLKPAGNNILITYLNDEVSLSEYLRHLNSLKDSYSITLFGLQGWGSFQNVEKDYLQNLNLNLYSTYFIDYSDNKVKSFLIHFRNDYKTEPILYAYQGFDAVYYFLNAMLHYGKSFEKCIQGSKVDMLENDFIFRKEEHGCYENTYLNIYKYQDYMLVNARK